MTNRKEMVSALRSIVVPELKRRGFTGTFPDFRRLFDSRTDLLTFQLDKYGGGFVLEVSQAKPGDFITSWGTLVPAQKLTSTHLELVDRHRVQPHSGSGTDNWFRFDDESCEEVASSVLPFVELVDQWFYGSRESSFIIPMRNWLFDEG